MAGWLAVSLFVGTATRSLRLMCVPFPGPSACALTDAGQCQADEDADRTHDAGHFAGHINRPAGHNVENGLTKRSLALFVGQ